MPSLRCWLWALILLTIILVAVVHCCWHAWRGRAPQLLVRVWQLRPRTPDDCPQCHLAIGRPQTGPPPAVPPWREGRSRRGAPRRIPTAGHACRNPRCLYYANIDAQVHALIAVGCQGRTDRI
jgi:hypothetical protein